MSLVRNISFVFFGAVTVAIVQSPAAIALTPVEVRSIAKEITVRIDGSNDTSGSGIIIQRQGTTYYVLTTKHVINKKGKFTIVAPDGKLYPINSGQIIKYPQVDLALVQFTSERSYRSADFGDSDKLLPGRTVYVAGWLSSALRDISQSFQTTDGRVTSLTNSREGYSIVYSNVTQDGMSGGPVIDDLGLVVGVHGLAPTEALGSRVGLNMGIPIKAFLKLDSPLYGRSVQGQQASGLIKEGDNLFKKEDYDGAFRAFNLAVQYNPNLGKAYLGRGASLDKQAHKIVLDLDKRGVGLRDALNNQSRLRLLQLALLDFNRAIELDPKIAEAYILRGGIHSSLRDHQKALTDFNQAIKLEPQNGWGYESRCSLRSTYARYDQNAYKSAIADCQKAIQLFSKQGSSGSVQMTNSTIITMESCRLSSPDRRINNIAHEQFGIIFYPPTKFKNGLTTLEFEMKMLEQCLYIVPNPIHPRDLIDNSRK
jgi:tetratricopeptide (TPR) repeat protein